MKSKYRHWVFVKRKKNRRTHQQRDSNACATVVIPALNEARRIQEVVAYALADSATAEVIVVDDSSIDDTAMLARQAGAKVMTSSMLGKGVSMRDGAAAATHDLVVYLDGDLTNLRPGIVTSLCLPLLNEGADFVKARFGRGGGRVTELTAKPMLKVFFPELAHLAQPLGGIIAARKRLLQTIRFEDDYGVDAGLLLDAHLAGAKLAEVDIGLLEHDSQPLQDLSLMANEVSRAIFDRAKKAGRLHVEQVTAMYENQRQVAAGIDYVLSLRRGRRCLLLLDMDGTVTPSRFALELARNTGNEAALVQLLDTPHDDAITRSERIAELFRFIHKQQFEQVARTLEIRPGVIEFVKQARRAGFMVGVVSDSYFVAADIIRRRIFADFALAHTLTFDGEVCNGQLQINPAFLPDDVNSVTPICKSNAMRCFLADKSQPPVELIWAVGDNLNDLEMLRLADNAFVIDPKSPKLLEEPGITLISEFNDLVELLTHEASESIEA
ncbi:MULTISPECIES: HAD-IB family phosphatase [Methylomonas]|uniref:Glycosyltransferase 2-like domain-containing protein n=1 Tax=Methylomonas koyamae TaxID=702114 RepID=A0A177N1Y6_9GAMM|nr:HAD-IB family phosphatase [Methylomonas koyamae]OAI11654.1 hypothetical protein A1355_15590 [Methylomonas koyamae]